MFPIYPCYLLLEFENSEYCIADLSSEQSLTGELFEPLKQWDSFRQVTVDADHITIQWPNGLDFDLDVLYADSTPFVIQKIMS